MPVFEKGKKNLTNPYKPKYIPYLLPSVSAENVVNTVTAPGAPALVGLYWQSYNFHAYWYRMTKVTQRHTWSQALSDLILSRFCMQAFLSGVAKLQWCSWGGCYSRSSRWMQQPRKTWVLALANFAGRSGNGSGFVLWQRDKGIARTAWIERPIYETKRVNMALLNSFCRFTSSRYFFIFPF